MKMLLKDYTSEFEDELNYGLMNKEADMPLVDFIKDSWRSLEVVPSIKITGFDYSERESEIDINQYIFKREKKRKKKDRFDYKFINNDRCGRLTTNMEVTLTEKNLETGENFIHVYPMKKSMLIPIQDEDGYMYIKGKRYYMIYQMVEKSTYTSNSSVTLKSLMPIAVKRGIIEEDEVLTNNLTNERLVEQGIDAVDIVGNHHKLPVYYIFVFKKEIPIMLFYLSKGLDEALMYLGVFDIISFVEKIPDDIDATSEDIYFQLSTKCYLKCNRELFEKYTYVQSIVGGFLTICTNRIKMDQLRDPKHWIKRIANPNNYDKGKDILKFFNRLLDRTTQNILKIHPYHKSNIYALLRWIMQEYNELRMKDNMDLANKRLRCNEYIASLLTKEFSRRLNRIISLGDKATIDTYKDLLKFPGDLKKIHQQVS